MSLYVLRYGSERGKGEYVGVDDSGRCASQLDAARWRSRKRAQRAASVARKMSYYDVRLVRLRPRRTLIGYVVRLDGPGEEPRWVGSISTYGLDTTMAAHRLVLRTLHGGYGASPLAGDWRARGYQHARVVPVYLRVRP